MSVPFSEQNQEKERETDKENKENQEKNLAAKEADSDEDGFELVDGTLVHSLYWVYLKLTIIFTAFEVYTILLVRCLL